MRKTNRLSLAILYIFITPLAFADNSDKIVGQANKKYQAQQYQEAGQLYKEALIQKPDSSVYNFNYGAALFKTKDLDQAVGSFEKALTAEDKRLEAKANYNIANSKYALGKEKADTEISGAVNYLRQALDYYKRAITLDPKDEDAKFNYEFVDKELKALLEKSKQQQSQGKEKQEQEQKQEESQQEKRREQGQPQEEPQSGNQDKKEEADAALEPQDLQEMSQQEAKMLLEGYRQEENARGELRDTIQGKEAGVSKDW